MGLYALLRERFGFLDWWPGETPLEILVGAVLTQQSAWTNVEKAIANLKSAHALTLHAIANASQRELEMLVRPSGFYRQKARRIRGIARHIIRNHGTLQAFAAQDADALRGELMGLDGIGNETADDIMLYVGGRRSFVIDAYTRRIMDRIYGLDKGMGYAELQSLFHMGIKRDAELYKDFHGQLVELAKRHCKAKPECGGCPVLAKCGFGGRRA